MVFRFLAIFLPSAFIFFWLYYHPGTIIIEIDQYIIQSTVLVGAIGFVAFYILLKLLIWLIWIPKQISDRRRLTSHKRIITKVENQISNIASGRFRALYTKLLSKQSIIETMMIFLTRCAEGTFDHQLLNQSLINAPKEELLFRWVAANYFLHLQQYSRALDELKSASVINPYHPWIILSLAKVYQSLQQWEQLYEHLIVNKSRLDRETYLELLEEAAIHQLEVKTSDKTGFYQIYNQLPRSIAQTVPFQNVLLRMYFEIEDYLSAKKLIEKTLKQSFEREAVECYENLPTITDEQLLKQLKLWHQMYPREKYLSKSLIRVALKNQQNEIAVSQADLIIKHQPNLHDLVQSLIVYRSHAPEKAKIIIAKLDEMIRIKSVF